MPPKLLKLFEKKSYLLSDNGPDGISYLEHVCINVTAAPVWAVTSAKHGNGVQQLLDEDSNTYWQSDGFQPHMIQAQFPRLTPLSVLAIHVNFIHDESYTPRKIVVRAGTHKGDIAEVASAECDSPVGWLCMPLVDGGQPHHFLYAAVLQICIIENHQNGRDTHIRGVRLFTVRDPPPFATTEFASMVTLR